ITKVSLTVFVFTFTFALAALVRVTTAVPLLTAHLASYSCLASLAVFLYLIDHVGKSLRPSGALWAVGSLGREVVESVYPSRLARVWALPPPSTAIPKARSRTGGAAWSWPSMSRDSCPWPNGPTASLKWCPRWGTSWRSATPCSAYSRVGRTCRQARCANRS